jgi:hypothetical protein
MKTTELNATEMETVRGGDFAYDAGRLLRFVYLSGGGFFAGMAAVDWVATSAINDAKANK